jgi:methionine sulfoxide reductase heme-binding subunit
MKLRLNAWLLFSVLALVVSVANLVGMPGADFGSARGMVPIVVRSVRFALPLFVVAFIASSLATLWPSSSTRWLLANRRYIGLSFAFGMAWHFTFVAYTIWNFGNPLNAKATALDAIGFVFLVMLTLTSFRPFAHHLSRVNWKRLHKTGVYVIWLVATAIYFHGVKEGYGGILYRIVFAVLLAAWALRVAAAAKKYLTSGSSRPSTISNRDGR